MPTSIDTFISSGFCTWTILERKDSISWSNKCTFYPWLFAISPDKVWCKYLWSDWYVCLESKAAGGEEGIGNEQKKIKTD